MKDLERIAIARYGKKGDDILSRLGRIEKKLDIAISPPGTVIKGEGKSYDTLVTGYDPSKPK